jgi:hypothetical protein
MGKIGFRKAKKVIQVAWMSAVNHGFQFSREQFFGGQDKKLARPGIAYARSGKRSRGEGTGTHQKVDFDLYAILGTGMVGVTKMPFPQSMIIDTVLDPVSKTRGDLGHGANDIRTFGEHLFALDLRDVVEIDINGETNQIKVEQIYRGTALKNDSVAKEGMLVELSEELTKMKDCFQVVWWEAGCIGYGL